MLPRLGSPREALALFTQALAHSSAGVGRPTTRCSRARGTSRSMRSPCRCTAGTAPATPSCRSRTPRRWSSGYPNAQLTTWPGEGHLALITHVAEVLDDIARHADASERLTRRVRARDATKSAATITVTTTSVDDVEPAERRRRAVADRADPPAGGDRVGEIVGTPQRHDDRGRHEVVQLHHRAAHLLIWSSGVAVAQPARRGERAHLVDEQRQAPQRERDRDDPLVDRQPQHAQRAQEAGERGRDRAELRRPADERGRHDEHDPEREEADRLARARRGSPAPDRGARPAASWPAR